MVPEDPPTPHPKPTVRGPYSAKTLHVTRAKHGQQLPCFVDVVLNLRAMYPFAVQYPKKNTLLVW